MKIITSYVVGALTVLFVCLAMYNSGKLALVSHEEYSGQAWNYLYYGNIDVRCATTTYKTPGLQYQQITAYSAYSQNQIDGGASVVTYGEMSPVVTLWDGGGRSATNTFQNLKPMIKKVVSKDNTPTIACLGELKADKSKW